MRPLWVASAILVAMLALMSLNARWLQHIMEPLTEEITQATQAAWEGEWSEAESISLRVQKMWDARVPVLCLFQSHKEVNEIALLLDESLVFLACRNLDDYTAMNTRARGGMETMMGMERFSIRNLF